jgi:hypothetical protein
MEVRDLLHTPAALLRGKEHVYLFCRKLGEPQSRSQQWGEEKNRRGLNPVRLAYSFPPHRLRHPDNNYDLYVYAVQLNG